MWPLAYTQLFLGEIKALAKSRIEEFLGQTSFLLKRLSLTDL